VPRPDLAASEEAVREQLSRERAALDELLDSETAPAGAAAAFGRMGQLYHAYDLLEAAAACYQNARSLEPNDGRWAYLAGLVLQRQGRLEVAREMFMAALDTAPEDAPTLLRLGQVDLAQNRLDSARSYFERAVAAEPACYAARFGLAEVARDTGDLETAAELFTAVLEAQPSAEQVHYPLAQVLQRLGRSEEAERHLQRTAGRTLKIGGRPHCPDPLDLELAELRTGTAAAVRRGLLLGLAGEGAQELDLLRKAVEDAPDDAVARQRFGSLLLRRGNVDDAVEQLSEATRLDPENPEIHSTLGIAFIRQQRPGEAEKSFRRALEIRPDSLHYQLQLALTLQQQGRCGDAVSVYSSILDQEPAHRQALLQRAICFNELGRLAEAGSDMGLLLDLHPPDDPAERLRLASMLLSLSGDDRALRHFEVVAASKASPQVRAQAHILIGQVQIRRGDRAAAEASFQRAASLDPSLTQQPHLQEEARPPSR
jgi:tetratricopeptide (TPR) repeat protein